MPSAAAFDAIGRTMPCPNWAATFAGTTMRYRFSPEVVALAAVREVRVDCVMNCDRCCARGLAASSGMPWPRSILSGSGCTSRVTIGLSAMTASTPRNSASRSAVIDSPAVKPVTRTSAVANVHTGTVVLRSSVIVPPCLTAAYVCRRTRTVRGRRSRSTARWHRSPHTGGLLRTPLAEGIHRRDCAPPVQLVPVPRAIDSPVGPRCLGPRIREGLRPAEAGRALGRARPRPSSLSHREGTPVDETGLRPWRWCTGST